MKITLPGQNVPISMEDRQVNPTWYEKLRFLEKLQPLSDIDNSAINAAIATKSNITRTFSSQSGTTYTFVLGDAGNVVYFTAASAVTAIVPANATAAFPVGTQIDLIQAGAGKVTLSLAGGVSMVSVNNNRAISAQYAAATMLKAGSDFWHFFGSIGP